VRVSVLKATKILFEGNAREVILPGEEGEISVLDFHQPFFCQLKQGYVVVKGILTAAAQTKKTEIDTGPKFLIEKGIAKMLLDELTIMVETRAN